VRIAEGEGETETKRRRETEMMQQQMAAYASTTISTELIQKVRSSSRCRPNDHLLPSCTALSLSELFPVLSDEDSKLLLPFLFVCVEFILHVTGNRARHRQRHAETETDRFLQRRSSLPCRKTLFNKQFAICVL
jgi:hypothetical protein